MIDEFQSLKTRVESQLRHGLDQVHVQPKLLDAMRYGVFNGGKRIRPILCYTTIEALNQPLKLADKTAAAIEFIHCYSLIHDDLPAMDDDDLRRGKPTVHIKFDEATAILAGDALQTLAFEELANDSEIDAGTKIELIQLISRASGPRGMVAGQMMDLEAENHLISKSELKEMHNRKTGDLISCSVMAGALLGQANTEQKAGLQEFGYKLGLAFQVQDDILDEIGDTAIMGKQQGADSKKQKNTFITAYGLDDARKYLKDLHEESIASLRPMGEKSESLIKLSKFVTQRDY
ncbi:MAG: geranylgeranyl pyrophosphate synthase [Candidatus Azotimanducaceae bacterium]|jgi:geranylgeranyl pyrophosphate synthase